MPSVDRSKEASTIAALRRADASLSFAPDVEAFSARLALEPAHVPLVRGTSLAARAKAGRRVLPGMILVASLSGSAVAMAQGAPPGSSLYGIKRASESLWLGTSIGPQDRASRLLGLAERRAKEVIAAERAGHHLLALQAANEARHDIKAAQELTPTLSPKERSQVDERARNEKQRVATVLGKDEARLHDQHDGDQGNSNGTSTPSGGGTGSSGASSDQQETATTPPGGASASPGAAASPEARTGPVEPQDLHRHSASTGEGTGEQHASD